MRSVVEVCNQRGSEEKDKIAAGGDADVEPEDRIIVFLRGGLLHTERGSETALLQVRGEQREGCEHRHQTVVLDGEDACQDDADEQHHQLLCAVAHGSPPKPVGCFFFQIVHVIPELLDYLPRECNAHSIACPLRSVMSSMAGQAPSRYFTLPPTPVET